MAVTVPCFSSRLTSRRTVVRHNSRVRDSSRRSCWVCYQRKACCNQSSAICLALYHCTTDQAHPFSDGMRMLSSRSRSLHWHNTSKLNSLTPAYPYHAKVTPPDFIGRMQCTMCSPARATAHTSLINLDFWFLPSPNPVLGMSAKLTCHVLAQWI